MPFESYTYKSREEIEAKAKSLGLYLPFTDNTGILHTPHAGFENRLVFQPMEGCDGSTEGDIGDLSVRRYLRYAEGGVGLIWFEAVAITPEARANPRQPWLNEKTFDSFARLVDQIKKAGMAKNGFAPKIILQATHSGRYSKPEGVPAPIIAYNNPLFEKDNPIDPSRIITDGELRRLEDCFYQTAKLSEAAGFDGIDIKCCHRYLNSELMSAYNRPGEYGGSLENRSRLLRNGVAAANAATGKDFIKTTRLNLYDAFPYPFGFGTDLVEGSTKRDPGELFIVMEALHDLGVRLVNMSMGNPYVNPHVNRPYNLGGYTPAEHPLEGVARMIQGVSELSHRFPNMDFVASGLSYLRQYAIPAAAALVENGDAAFVGFGRGSFAYPDFPRELKEGTFDEKKVCIACSKCTELMRAGSVTGCVIRDSETYLPLYREFCMKK